MIAQECAPIEDSESHPAEKAVLCVNTKKKSKVFSDSFFCFFYRKQAVGSGLVETNRGATTGDHLYIASLPMRAG